MAIMMIMTWDDVSLADYDRVRELVRFETDVPEGGLYHVAAYDGSALRITDVWESAEHFQQFVEQRLMPGVQELGITSEPAVEIFPAHAIFAPGYTPKS